MFSLLAEITCRQGRQAFGPGPASIAVQRASMKGSAASPASQTRPSSPGLDRGQRRAGAMCTRRHRPPRAGSADSGARRSHGRGSPNPMGRRSRPSPVEGDMWHGRARVPALGRSRPDGRQGTGIHCSRCRGGGECYPRHPGAANREHQSKNATEKSHEPSRTFYSPNAPSAPVVTSSRNLGVGESCLSHRPIRANRS
jgi:hypothetical protein